MSSSHILQENRAFNYNNSTISARLTYTGQCGDGLRISDAAGEPNTFSGNGYREADMSETAKDFDFYLADPFNQRIYQDLENFGFDAVKFFDFFYRLVSLVEENKPSGVLQELDARNCQGGLRLYIIYYLTEKYSRQLEIALDMLPSDDKRPEASLFVLNKEYERLEKLFPPDIFVPDDAPISDRARRAVGISKISNDAIANIIKKKMEESERERVIDLRARQDERERLEKQLLPQIQTAISAAIDKSKKSSEFTTNRQVLALCFMLKHLGIKGVDKTVQARFIEFLTGKNYKKIYDSVREAEDIVFIKGGADAGYIREWFEKLGLTEIMKDLDTMLDKKSWK